MKSDLVARIKELLWLSETEMSHEDVRDILHHALRDDLQLGDDAWFWVADVYDDRVIYKVDGGNGAGYYQRSYTIADDGTVTLGDPIEVRRVTNWEPVQAAEAHEAATATLTGDIIPLIEADVRESGRFTAKIIDAGWGSSGYYPAEVLKRDGPQIFTKGMHMHLDHPTVTEEFERPERSVTTIGGVLAEDAYWDDDGPAGPGLYAAIEPMGAFKEVLPELAPHIGLSIRAEGRAIEGEAEGRRGPIITELVAGHSVDYVTRAGRGGQVLSLMESARAAGAAAERVEEGSGKDTDVAENIVLSEAQYNELLAKLERLEERDMLRTAVDGIRRKISEAQLPDITKQRLLQRLSQNPPLKDGALDEAAVDQVIQAEREYLADLLGGDGNVVTGMGGSAPSIEDELQEAERMLEAAFADLPENLRKHVIAGR